MFLSLFIFIPLFLCGHVAAASLNQGTSPFFGSTSINSLSSSKLPSVKFKPVPLQWNPAQYLSTLTPAEVRTLADWYEVLAALLRESWLTGPMEVCILRMRDISTWVKHNTQQHMETSTRNSAAQSPIVELVLSLEEALNQLEEDLIRLKQNPQLQKLSQETKEQIVKNGSLTPPPFMDTLGPEADKVIALLIQGQVEQAWAVFEQENTSPKVQTNPGDLCTPAWEQLRLLFNLIFFYLKTSDKNTEQKSKHSTSSILMSLWKDKWQLGPGEKLEILQKWIQGPGSIQGNVANSVTPDKALMQEAIKSRLEAIYSSSDPGTRVSTAARLNWLWRQGRLCDDQQRRVIEEQLMNDPTLAEDLSNRWKLTAAILDNLCVEDGKSRQQSTPKFDARAGWKQVCMSWDSRTPVERLRRALKFVEIKQLPSALEQLLLKGEWDASIQWWHATYPGLDMAEGIWDDTDPDQRKAATYLFIIVSCKLPRLLFAGYEWPISILKEPYPQPRTVRWTYSNVDRYSLPLRYNLALALALDRNLPTGQNATKALSSVHNDEQNALDWIKIYALAGRRADFERMAAKLGSKDRGIVDGFRGTLTLCTSNSIHATNQSQAVELVQSRACIARDLYASSINQGYQTMYTVWDIANRLCFSVAPGSPQSLYTSEWAKRAVQGSNILAIRLGLFLGGQSLYTMCMECARWLSGSSSCAAMINWSSSSSRYFSINTASIDSMIQTLAALKAQLAKDGVSTRDRVAVQVTDMLATLRVNRNAIVAAQRSAHAINRAQAAHEAHATVREGISRLGKIMAECNCVGKERIEQVVGKLNRALDMMHISEHGVAKVKEQGQFSEVFGGEYGRVATQGDAFNYRRRHGARGYGYDVGYGTEMDFRAKHRHQSHPTITPLPRQPTPIRPPRPLPSRQPIFTVSSDAFNPIRYRWVPPKRPESYFDWRRRRPWHGDGQRFEDEQQPTYGPSFYPNMDRAKTERDFYQRPSEIDLITRQGELRRQRAALERERIALFRAKEDFEREVQMEGGKRRHYQHWGDGGLRYYNEIQPQYVQFARERFIPYHQKRFYYGGYGQGERGQHGTQQAQWGWSQERAMFDYDRFREGSTSTHYPQIITRQQQGQQFDMFRRQRQQGMLTPYVNASFQRFAQMDFPEEQLREERPCTTCQQSTVAQGNAMNTIITKTQINTGVAKEEREPQCTKCLLKPRLL